MISLKDSHCQCTHRENEILFFINLFNNLNISNWIEHYQLSDHLDFRKPLPLMKVKIKTFYCLIRWSENVRYSTSPSSASPATILVVLKLVLD